MFADNTTWNPLAMEIETRGSSGNDYITASSIGDASTDDLIYAYGGTDTVFAGDGDDVIHGGAGNDLLYGESGDDTFHYSTGDGNDTIIESSGTDSIKLGPGIDEGDLSYGRAGYNLIINAGASTITVLDHRAKRQRRLGYGQL